MNVDLLGALRASLEAAARQRHKDMVDRIAAVRDLHRVELMPTSDHYRCEPSECDRAGEGELLDWCVECRVFAPCDTILVLDGACRVCKRPAGVSHKMDCPRRLGGDR